ncbi:MAG TPA: nuclear transport factor 2 family protein [Armatimonadota bacterium]|jgi:hypothetical protein
MELSDYTIQKLYDAFNARDIDSVTAALHQDVDWPNGWEGGRLRGREAVREYWLRQWKAISPHVEPTRVRTGKDGRVVVDVHARIQDKEGKPLAEQTVEHVYTFEEGLIKRMDIQTP